VGSTAEDMKLQLARIEMDTPKPMKVAERLAFTLVKTGSEHGDTLKPQITAISYFGQGKL